MLKIIDLIIISFAVFSFLVYFNNSKISFKKFIMRLPITKNPYIYELLNCPFCQSFWIGILFTIFYNIAVLRYLVFFFFISGLFLILYMLYELFQMIFEDWNRKYNKKEKKKLIKR